MPKPRLSYKQAEQHGSTAANAGRFADRRKAPGTVGSVGKAPAYFKDNERTVWSEISVAIPAGVAGASDRFAVELAARLLAEFRADPLMAASRLAVLMNLLSRLGLDPQARTKLHVESEDEELDAFSTFMKTDDRARKVQ